MGPAHQRELSLSKLRNGLPGVTSEIGAAFSQAAAVCLHHHNHPQDVQFTVTGSFSETFTVAWTEPNAQARRAWSDLPEAVECGACALAFLLTLALTDYTVIDRSRKGTGFDYWLGHRDRAPFQNAARLEVSGVLTGDARAVDARVAHKLKQLKASDDTMIPAYVVVVEFGTPASKMVRK